MSDKFKKLINSDFGKISKDVLEMPLDSFIDNETLKKVPFFGTIVNLYNLSSTISDKIFANKLIHFLKKIEDINPNIIQREIQYIDDSNEYKHKVGEKILEIINRIDSEEKPKIIGRLFKNFILKKIPYIEFLKFCYLIEQLFYFDVIKLIDYDERNSLFVEQEIEIYNFGLCEGLGIGEWGEISNKEKEYQDKVKAKITDLGKKLVEFGLKET